MGYGLSNEEAKYLKEINFEVLYEKHKKNESYPYIILKGIDDSISNFPIMYYSGAESIHSSRKIHHPSNMDRETLVNVMEYYIIEGMDDGNAITPHQTIKIFVEDPWWNQVASVFVEKHI